MQGAFIKIIKLAADRNTMRKLCYLHAIRGKKISDVMRGGLPIHCGIECEDHFSYRAG